MEVGQTITLTGKNRFGKNRVKELGDQWIVRKIQDKVACCNGGKGALLTLVKDKWELRWIDLPTDDNFDWT